MRAQSNQLLVQGSSIQLASSNFETTVGSLLQQTLLLFNSL